MRELALCLSLSFILGLASPELGSAATPPLDPATQAALALRAKYEVVVPASSSAIYLSSWAVHHSSDQLSSVAWKDRAGVWNVSYIGESGPGGLLKIEPKATPEVRRIVPAPVAKQLDRLLARRAFYRQTSPAGPPTGIGAMHRTLEVVTPKGHVVIKGYGKLGGDADEVIRLVVESLNAPPTKNAPD